MGHGFHNHHRRRGGWPFGAFMASGGGKGWGGGFGFGPDGPFGPHGPFGPGGPFGPRGPFGPGGRFGGRQGRRRGRMFGAGELRLVLLKLIADEPRHGYELIKAIEDLTGGNYAPSPGTIYPTLSLLEDEGAILQVPDEESRKAYEATEAGRGELDRRSEEIDAIFERLSEQAEEHRPFSSPDMFRALGNLGNVLKNRARAGQLDEKTVEEIVDMIDEMAKRIERL